MINEQQKVALTFGAFVMSEAAQILFARQMHTTEKNVQNIFEYENAMYYRQFTDAIVKAYKALEYMNKNVSVMYAQLGDALKHDNVRKVANDIIRFYCDFRNYVQTTEDATKWDSILFNMSSNKNNIIESDVRNSFRLR